MNARDMRMAWYVPGTQPGCKPCSVIFKMSIVVIVWPLGSKTRQTSRIRRDSENWVIFSHTPKLPKIIDRRNVQVGIYIIYIYIYNYYMSYICVCIDISYCIWTKHYGPPGGFLPATHRTAMPFAKWSETRNATPT